MSPNNNILFSSQHQITPLTDNRLRRKISENSGSTLNKTLGERARFRNQNEEKTKDGSKNSDENNCHSESEDFWNIQHSGISEEDFSQNSRVNTSTINLGDLDTTLG